MDPNNFGEENKLDNLTETSFEEAQPPVNIPPVNSGKKKKTGLIVGVTCGVAAVACGIIFIPKLLKSDKERVQEAFANSNSVVGDYLEELLGVSDIQTAIREKGGSVKENMKVDVSSGEEIENLGVSFDAAYDPINQIVNETFGMLYNDEELISAEFIGTADHTYFQLADWIEGYLSIPNENALIALQNSPLGKSLDLADMPAVSFDYFSDVASNSCENSKLWDLFEVKKQGTEKIVVYSDHVRAKEYDLILEEEKIEKEITSALDNFAETAKENPAVLEEADIDAATLDQYVSQIKAFIPTVIPGDLVIKTYVSNKEVVKVVCEDHLSILGVQLGYNFNYENGKKGRSAKLAFSAAGQEVGLLYDATVDNSSEAITEDGSIKALYNNEAVATILTRFAINKQQNTFSGSISLTDESYPIGASFEGTIQGIEKGETFTVKLDKATLVNGSEEYLKLSGDMEMSTNNKGAKGINSDLPIYDLTTMTEEDLDNIMDANQGRIESWIQKLEEKFGDVLDGDAIDEFTNQLEGEDGEYYENYGNEEFALEDCVLKQGDYEVSILECMDGYEISYAGDSFVDFYGEDYSTIEYALDVDTTLENELAMLEDYSEDTDIEVKEFSRDKKITVDGAEIPYAVITYTFAGVDVSEYAFVKELGNGAFLRVQWYVYKDMPVEELAKSLSDKYIKVK